MKNSKVLLSRDSLEQQLTEFMDDQIGVTRMGNVFSFESEVMVRQCNHDLHNWLKQHVGAVDGNILDPVVHETRGATVVELIDLISSKINLDQAVQQEIAADAFETVSH